MRAVVRLASRCSLAATLALHLFSVKATAGNLDAVTMGGDAALMGGAATASASGPGSTWYNPAGLGRERGEAVDVSFNAYVLRLGRAPRLDVDAASGERSELPRTDFSAIPSAIGYSRRLGSWDVALGVFAPTRERADVATVAKLAGRDGASDLVGLEGRSELEEYYVGASVARALTSRLRVGVTLFGYYGSLVEREAVLASASSAATSSFQLVHVFRDQTQLGAQIAWGLQCDLTTQWRFGFALRTPVVRLYEDDAELALVAFTTRNSPRGFATGTLGSQSGFAAGLVRPMRARAGLGWHRRGYALALDSNVQAPLRDTREFGPPTTSVWNARLGGSAVLSRAVTIGGGLFTDRSPYLGASSSWRGSLDFYGLSLALQLRDRFQLAGTNTKARTLEFSTTFSLSYAYGTGRVGDAVLTTGATTRLQSQLAGVHEIVFQIGSGLERR